ncbi:MAG: hypothetical protein LBE27_00790 [Deltaproteobacteria bacterium]|jgi:hypothetical protein|nr:hypothetical protein [Deltaproteobacteria bacterium]
MYKSLIEEFSYINENINYASIFQGNALFSTSKKIKWKNKYLYAHIFVVPQINDQFRDIFLNDIFKMYENACSDPERYKDDPCCQHVLTFKKSKISPNGYDILKNNEAYQEMRSRGGSFILLSTRKQNSVKTLEYFRNRQVFKRTLDIIKRFQRKNSDFIQNDESFENCLFIAFLSTVLISMIHKVMINNKIYIDKTMEEVLVDLSDLKAKILDGDRYIVDPLTDLTRRYFDSFGCPYPHD